MVVVIMVNVVCGRRGLWPSWSLLFVAVVVCGHHGHCCLWPSWLWPSWSLLFVAVVVVAIMVIVVCGRRGLWPSFLVGLPIHLQDYRKKSYGCIFLIFFGRLGYWIVNDLIDFRAAVDLD